MKKNADAGNPSCVMIGVGSIIEIETFRDLRLNQTSGVHFWLLGCLDIIDDPSICQATNFAGTDGQMLTFLQQSKIPRHDRLVYWTLWVSKICSDQHRRYALRQTYAIMLFSKCWSSLFPHVMLHGVPDSVCRRWQSCTCRGKTKCHKSTLCPCSNASNLHKHALVPSSGSSICASTTTEIKLKKQRTW